MSKSTFNKLIIFSVEGEDSNTEVNYFSGLDDHFTDISVSVFAIGKHANKNAALYRLKLALQKHRDLSDFLHVWIVFVGDKDKQEQIGPMENTIKWCQEFIENNKPILFDKSAIVQIHPFLIGDNGHKIESSLIRIGATFPKECKGKRESFKNLFNESMSADKWWNDGELNIDTIISDLSSIKSEYVRIFVIIKEAIREKGK